MSRSGCGHVVVGPLSAFGEGFRAELLGQGYTWGSAAKQIHLVANLSRWLGERRLEAGDLSAGVVEEFFEARRAQGRSRLVSPRAAAPLLGYLRGLGVVVDDPAVSAPSEVGLLLQGYEDFLVRERRLAGASVRSYLGVARRFLVDDAVRAVGMGGLSAEMVVGFVGRECGRRSPGSAKATVTGMRSLLRFLYLSAGTPTLLSAAVPSVASWQLASLPKAITAREVAALVGSCDRRSVQGRRDFAILTVLARLGLRAGEVSALDLGDIAWRAGEVTVRGKGGGRDRLPLPVDVGEAVAGWLVRRPSGLATSAVFVRMRAPHRRLSCSGTSAVVRQASRRAGLEPIGAHRLRHTTATQMLGAGATLAEIGQILRHSRLQTTAVYAKVDTVALSALAQPWPEARS